MSANRIRTIVRLLMLLLSAGVAGGCATGGYLGDRSRDAADILTFTLGAGGGVKLRAGPVQIAALDNTDIIGLRGGQWLLNGPDLVERPGPPRFSLMKVLDTTCVGDRLT